MKHRRNRHRNGSQRRLREVLFVAKAAPSPLFCIPTSTAIVRRKLSLQPAPWANTYVVQTNNQLTGAWTEIWNSSQGFAHAQVVEAVDQADRTLVPIKDAVAMAGQPAGFLRVKVVQN